MHYKEDSTTFGGTKKGTILQNGIVNIAITEIIFKILEKKGIETHYLVRNFPNNPKGRVQRTCELKGISLQLIGKEMMPLDIMINPCDCHLDLLF